MALWQMNVLSCEGNNLVIFRQYFAIDWRKAGGMGSDTNSIPARGRTQPVHIPTCSAHTRFSPPRKSEQRATTLMQRCMKPTRLNRLRTSKEDWESAKRRSRRLCPNCDTGILINREKSETGHICADCNFQVDELPVGVMGFASMT